MKRFWRNSIATMFAVLVSTGVLAEQEINILDISQTLMQEYFTMIMLVDLTDCPMSFDALSRYLQEKGEARGLSVHIQRQDIFDAMHRI